MKKGNERRRWHGTVSRRCKFLGKKQKLPSHGNCDDKKCAICSIVNIGLRLPNRNSGYER